MRLIESQIKGVKKGRDQLWVSVLPRCASYRESNKASKERQGPTLRCPFNRGVRLIESQIKGVKKGRDQLWVSVLPRCASYRESNKASKERQGPTLRCPFNRGVRLIESQIKGVKKGRDQLWVSV